VRRLAPVLLLLFAGCEAESLDLDGRPLPDAGAHDAGPVVDGSLEDASQPADAGAPEDAGGPEDAGMMCTHPGYFGFEVSGAIEDFQGPARVTSVAPLTLEAWGGPFTFALPTEVPVQDALAVNDEVYVDLTVYRPWWSEARVFIFGLNPMGGPAGLRFGAWAGSGFRSISADGMSTRHAQDGCVFDNEGCGPQAGMRLIVQYQGGRVAIDNGQLGQLADLLIANRGSTQYQQAPQCTDTPMDWYGGWLVKQPAPPLDCASMQRDDCIEQPGCVLWGSEDSDPGYTCRDAVHACEFNTPDNCTDMPGCTWDPGSCYCPEGGVCSCGGGPAPKCRGTCGGWGGGPCPSTHYCELDLFEPPICIPPADIGGVCEWIPDTCEGTPNIPVCTCAAANPDAQRMDNDCVRRQQRAQGTAPLNQCAP